MRIIWDGNDGWAALKVEFIRTKFPLIWTSKKKWKNNGLYSYQNKIIEKLKESIPNIYAIHHKTKHIRLVFKNEEDEILFLTRIVDLVIDLDSSTI
jgi:hypothetical protein